MAIFKDNNVFVGKETQGKKVGTYEIINVSESPIKITIKGSYDTSLAPQGGGGDALHSFENRKKDDFGGAMNGIINSVLLSVYNKKINPYVSSLSIKFGPNEKTGPMVYWEATVTQSPDDKAYIGMNSRGGAGNVSSGTAKDRALQGANQKKKDYPNELNPKEPNMTFLDILDYNNPYPIRQIFFQFTRPIDKPPHPKGTVPIVDQVSINKPISPSTQPAGSPEDAIKNGTVGIKLVKKSGPGELMGIVEFTSYFGEAVIEGLQFDEPGEYVIQAVPNDPNVKPTEFIITVSGDPNPESVEKPVEKPVEGSRPIIAQIDKPSISLKPIDFEILNSDAQLNIETAKSIGLTPFLWYNGYQIKIADIKSLSLFHEGLTPCTQVQFIDSTGIIKKDGFPLDDTTFEVFLNSGSPMLKSIHMKFKVKDFQQNKVGGTYTMTGQIDLKSYHKINFKSYKGTSFEVLREISKELELGFNSNIQNTNDSMNWFNTGLKYRNFVSNIVKNSYIDDQSFVMAYIDFYYCFNYVDVEKEWRRDVSSDVGVSSGALSQLGSDKTEDKIVSLLLTNDASSQGTDLYFIKYKLRNNSTSKSLEEGQRTVTKYYDKNKKSFLIFDVEAQTTPGSDKIILKGKPSDTKDLNENYRTVYGGKIDLDNSHSNFKYAKTQNERNLNELNKISVDIEMGAANFNFYKFQKIRILFVNAAGTVTDPDITQQRISGDWMIIEITYNWSGGKLKQNLVCVRKELEKTDEEKSEQTTKSEPEKKSDEKNEEVKVVPPNSEFEPGETYTVKDKGGKIYTVTIEKLLENGNEVQGYVIEKLVQPDVPTPTVKPVSTGVTGSVPTGATGSGG